MLNEVTCENILNSDITKMFGAERIVRLQMESSFQCVPSELFLDSLKMVFELDSVPDDIRVLIPAYKAKWPNPLALKEILSWLPRSFYLSRIKWSNMLILLTKKTLDREMISWYYALSKWERELNMDLKDCRVAFKRNRKYYRGELVNGRIVKTKQYKHLGDIPKWEKYITIKFYLRKSKSSLNLSELYSKFCVDNLYLLIEEIPVEQKVRKSNRGRPPETLKDNVIKVEKTPKADRISVSKPIPEGLSRKLWEKAWFKVKNPLCLSCVKKCKQSARVDIVVCPPYKKKG
jgi:hypothetical protein